MNFVRNFFSAIFGSLLILSLGILIVVYSITSVFFDEEFILGTLQKNNTYDKVAQEVVPTFLTYALTQRFQEENPDQQVAEKISARLDKKIFEQLAPDLQKIFESSYSFVTGDIDSFEVRIELKNYTPQLEAGLNSAISSLQAEGQVGNIDLSELSTDLQQGSNASLYITQDKLEVTGLQELNTQTAQNTPEESFLRQGREALVRLLQAQSLLLVATVVLTILLFLTRIPHFLSGFKWLATTSISAAFFPLILSFLLFVTKPVGIISRFLRDQDEVANFSTVVDLFDQNLSVISEKVFLNILMFSGMLMIFGIGLYILVFFLSKRTHNPAS